MKGRFDIVSSLSRVTTTAEDREAVSSGLGEDIAHKEVSKPRAGR